MEKKEEEKSKWDTLPHIVEHNGDYFWYKLDQDSFNWVFTSVPYDFVVNLQKYAACECTSSSKGDYSPTLLVSLGHISSSAAESQSVPQVTLTTGGTSDINSNTSQSQSIPDSNLGNNSVSTEQAPAIDLSNIQQPSAKTKKVSRADLQKKLELLDAKLIAEATKNQELHSQLLSTKGQLDVVSKRIEGISPEMEDSQRLYQNNASAFSTPIVMRSPPNNKHDNNIQTTTTRSIQAYC